MIHDVAFVQVILYRINILSLYPTEAPPIFDNLKDPNTYRICPHFFTFPNYYIKNAVNNKINQKCFTQPLVKITKGDKIN